MAEKDRKRRYRESEKGKATATAYNRRYREEHREEIAETKRRYRQKNREKVNAALRAYHAKNPTKKAEYRRAALERSPAYQMYREWREQPCHRCGIRDWRVIQAHHLNPSLKAISVVEAARLMDAGKLGDELTKCIPLCANCHLILHHHPDTAG